MAGQLCGKGEPARELIFSKVKTGTLSEVLSIEAEAEKTTSHWSGKAKRATRQCC